MAREGLVREVHTAYGDNYEYLVEIYIEDKTRGGWLGGEERAIFRSWLGDSENSAWF
jgi:hypothetical protein